MAPLVADLGGAEVISAQMAAVIGLAATSKLLLDSIDRYLLELPCLLNKKRRAVYPVVLQRQQIADALARYMAQLGLERRPRAVQSLEAYVAERYARRTRNENPESDSNEIPGSPQDARSGDHPGGDLADAADRPAGALAGDGAASGESAESGSPHPQSEVPA